MPVRSCPPRRLFDLHSFHPSPQFLIGALCFFLTVTEATASTSVAVQAPTTELPTARQSGVVRAPVITSTSKVSSPAKDTANNTVLLRHGSLQLGTYVETLIAGDAEAARSLSALATSEIERLENLFSAHRDSPVSRLNASDGSPARIPSELADLLLTALDVAKDTDGAFNPAIGPLAAVWAIGFGGKTVPEADAIDRARQLSDWRTIRVRTSKETETEPEAGYAMAQLLPGQSIDLGGIAKGFIGNSVADTLKAAGLTQGLLNLGGDVFAIGEKSPGEPWRIGLQYPNHDRGIFFATVRAKDTAVVSSGGYERFFEVNGRRYSHILDSKTGRPATTDLSSVTVIDTNGPLADARATALFAMGWDKATDYLKRRPELKVILLHTNLRDVRLTPAALPLVTLTFDDLKLTLTD